MKYRVSGRLEFDLDEIEANSEEEAFELASDMAMHGGGDWFYTVEKQKEESE